MIETSGHPAESSPFTCEVVYIERRAVVSVTGEVDMATAPVLMREVLATLEAATSGTTIDLAGVTFLDSSGIRVLVNVREAALEHGTSLTLASVPERVEQVLTIAGLDEQFGLPSPD